jgi:hypothetical protein
MGNSNTGFKAEFVGGPFDGLIVFCPELVRGTAMPVNRNMLAKLAGGPTNRHQRFFLPTSSMRRAVVVPLCEVAIGPCPSS